MTGSAAGTTKIAVVGAGSVGATAAYACLIRGIGRTIAMYDVNADKTRAEVLDLQHGLQFVPQATVIGSDDIEVCRGADLVVITAGAKQKPGQTAWSWPRPTSPSPGRSCPSCWRSPRTRSCCW